MADNGNDRAVQWTKRVWCLAPALATSGDIVIELAFMLFSPEHIHFLHTGSDIMAQGREAIKMARDMEQQFVPPSDPSQFDTLVPAFFNAALIHLSRIFSDSAWAIVDPDIPGADELPRLNHRALAILDSIETRFGVADLEAVVFCPLVYASSLELKDLESRERVRRVYKICASKGLAVAKTYLSDIDTAWALVARFNGVSFN